MRRLLIGLSALLLISCGGGGGGHVSPVPITISISPTSATVSAGATQQFTATVAGTNNTAVTWQVEGVTGGNSTVGTISTSGLYTAPLSPPSTGQVTVSAISQADSSRTASAAVTVLFSDASLSGLYSYTLSGDDYAGGFYLAVGSFEADGNGNILNGIQDINHGTGFFDSQAFTGTYSVGPDGRGSASLTNTVGAIEIRLVLLSNERGRFIEYEANSNGRGEILKRDPADFSTAAITGGYAFGFTGSDSVGDPETVAGRFTANGQGTISGGAEDLNEGGTVSQNLPFAGTYSVDANGRGTLQITAGSVTTNYVFHVVSSDTLFIVESDYPYPAVVGTARAQQAGSFSNASLTGDYAFLIPGVTPSGATATAGRFTSDGSGGLTGGVVDENLAGTLSQNIAFTGNASVVSNGRAPVTLTSTTVGDFGYTFYMVSTQEAFVVETDGVSVAGGTVLAQADGPPFDNSSASGSFGFTVFAPDTDTDQSGQITLDGAGALSGTEDVNDFGTLTGDAAFTGNYSMSSNGRAAGTVTPAGGGTAAQVVFYAVSDSRLFVIQVDSAFVGSGNIEKQF
jgi:hypothetical protein